MWSSFTDTSILKNTLALMSVPFFFFLIKKTQRRTTLLRRFNPCHSPQLPQLCVPVPVRSERSRVRADRQTSGAQL